MKMIITGFDPFGGENVNPSYEAVKLLPEKIGDIELIKIELPTAFRKSVSMLEKEIEKHRPDFVLSIGQAGGRSSITIEKVAINLKDAPIEDNEGEKPVDVKVYEDGEDGLFSTLPVKLMVNDIRKHGIPANISYTAGTYVCNTIMYSALYLAKKKYKNMKCGFIHVPFITSQTVNKAMQPSMSIENICMALERAIYTVSSEEKEGVFPEGKTC